MRVQILDRERPASSQLEAEKDGFSLPKTFSELMETTISAIAENDPNKKTAFQNKQIILSTYLNRLSPNFFTEEQKGSLLAIARINTSRKEATQKMLSILMKVSDIRLSLLAQAPIIKSSSLQKDFIYQEEVSTLEGLLNEAEKLGWETEDLSQIRSLSQIDSLQPLDPETDIPWKFLAPIVGQISTIRDRISATKFNSREDTTELENSIIESVKKLLDKLPNSVLVLKSRTIDMGRGESILFDRQGNIRGIKQDEISNSPQIWSFEELEAIIRARYPDYKSPHTQPEQELPQIT